MPELQLGFWIEQGHYRTPDAGLLRRSLSLVKIYQVAQRAASDLASLSSQEAALIMPLKREADGGGKKRRRR